MFKNDLNEFHFLVTKMDEPSLGTAKDIPDGFKTVLAQQYDFLHAQGVTRQIYLNALKSAGFTVTASTLERWVRLTNTTGSAISQSKETGASPSLDREQRNVKSGMVLHEIGLGNMVTLGSFKEFVMKYLGISISCSTVSRYLKEDGFVSKTGKGFIVDEKDLSGLSRLQKLWKRSYQEFMNGNKDDDS